MRRLRRMELRKTPLCEVRTSSTGFRAGAPPSRAVRISAYHCEIMPQIPLWIQTSALSLQAGGQFFSFVREPSPYPNRHS